MIWFVLVMKNNHCNKKYHIYRICWCWLLLLNFGPHVLEMVYTRFEQECRSLAHVRQKIDKSGGKRNIYIFFNPVWAVFCSLYPSPLLPKLSGFLRLIRSLHNAKFIPFFMWSLKLKKSLRICTKKNGSAAVAIFWFQLRLWFWLSFVRYLTILGISCHSLHVEKLTYTFIRS